MIIIAPLVQNVNTYFRINAIFFDYRKNENITYANVYSEFVSLVSNLVGWELLPEGSPIRKPKEEKEAQDFHDFIQNLKPSDFKKFIDENPESEQ